MVKSFKHKGLKKFYESGSKRGIQGDHADERRMQLLALDTAQVIEDLDIPGYHLHPLKRKRKGVWAISIMRVITSGYA